LGALIADRHAPRFHAVLSVIPGSGCRLFLQHGEECFAVVDDNGDPKFFPSIEPALVEVAAIPCVDHHVTIDILSFLPSTMYGYAAASGMVRASSSKAVHTHQAT
jgi:hypothetical protein